MSPPRSGQAADASGGGEPAVTDGEEVGAADVRSLRAVAYRHPSGDASRFLEVGVAGGPGPAAAPGRAFGDELTVWRDPAAWRTRLHPADRDRVLGAFDVAEPGRAVDIEYRLVRHDGLETWVQDQARLVAHEDGAIEWRGVMVDVTKPKATEDRLRAAEIKYRSLVERIPAIVYIDEVDDDLSTTYISPQIEWLLGVLPHEYVAEPALWGRMLHPDDRERAMTAYLEGRQSGRPFSFEYRLIARDGRVVWFRDEAVVLTDVAGRPTQVQGVMLDITEAKEAEEARNRLEERNKDLVETAQDVVFTLGPDATLTSLNPAFERLLGWPREGWLGKPFHPLLHPDDLPVAFEQMERIVQGLTPPAFEVRVQKQGGEYAVGEFTITPQFRDGVVIGAIGIARDITDRKRVAEELREAVDAAESANRAKSEFLANMSHEIRTPLNAVIGLSDLVLGTDLTAEQRDYLETIKASGDALLAVISDILDFSKIEAGRLDIEHAPFDIRACVEEALDLVTSSAATRGLELAYLVDQEVPATLMGDVTRVRQILTNLLSNAVKFTESGEVVVTVSSRPRDERRHDVHVAVIDTGVGIPPEAMDGLFDSFTQVDASVTRRYGGTGLGLAISRRLAERMGGGLWAESTLGAGSTFHFTILAELGPELAVRRLAEGGHLHGLRVLVVDDNATNRLIVSKQSRTWGMVPFEASSPAEAMQLIEHEGRFDVAVLDMCMPGVNGETLAREIRQHPSGGRLPLVMLTSLGRRIDDPEDSPFAAYLTKPVKPSRLHDTLAEVLAAARQRPLGGDRQPGPRAVTGPVPAAHDAGLGARHPLRILIAEDNAVNRKVVLRMLERIGYAADVAVNGREVIAALERRLYDVILMDVQMPELDGLETSRWIRRSIPAGSRPRVVAMTAHALQGDRERCFEAGMEDYLSKPIELGALAEALARCVPLPAEAHRVTGRSIPSDDRDDEGTGRQPEVGRDAAVVVDPSALAGFAEQLGEGGEEVLREVVEVFLEDTPTLLAELRSAAGSKDLSALDRAAHTLKSSSATLGARELSSLCQDLEALARSGDVPDGPARVDAISRAFDRVRAELDGLRRTA